MDVERWALNVLATLTSRRIRNFQFTLLRWYRRHGRALPWRQTRDPYAILVSEFMLQQTQVAAVIPYYNEWLRRFPDFAALAQAPESDILHAWQGLGYYARARNLHAVAKTVQHRHGGRFPRNLTAISELPGIGRYTANAVATFAFDQPVPIVETNTARVLARLFDFHSPIDRAAGREELWERARTLVPRYSARIYNSALVDLGALICSPRQPKCRICPVKKFCRVKDPETLPNKKSASSDSTANRASRVHCQAKDDFTSASQSSVARHVDLAAVAKAIGKSTSGVPVGLSVHEPSRRVERLRAATKEDQ